MEVPSYKICLLYGSLEYHIKWLRVRQNPLLFLTSQGNQQHVMYSRIRYVLHDNLTLLSVHVQSDCYSHIAFLRYDLRFLYFPNQHKVHTCLSVRCSCLHEQRYVTQRYRTLRNATKRNATKRHGTQRCATKYNETQRNAMLRNSTQCNETEHNVKQRNATECNEK